MENKTSEPPLRGPNAGGTEPVAPISKARAAVLQRLRACNGTLTVDALAAETGQHANTVREHLDALVGSGLATRTPGLKAGRGRPASLYAPAVHDPRPAAYAALAAALARHIATTSPDPASAGDLAGRQWAHALAGTGGRTGAGNNGTSGNGTGAGLHGAVRSSAAGGRRTRLAVAASLQEAGFGIQGNTDATEFTLTTCPIVDTARENPEVVCAVHLGLVKGLLEGSGVPEGGVKLVPFAAPGICRLSLPSAAAR